MLTDQQTQIEILSTIIQTLTKDMDKTEISTLSKHSFDLVVQQKFKKSAFPNMNISIVTK